MSSQHRHQKQTSSSAHVSDTQNTPTDEVEYKNQNNEVHDDDETLAVAGQAIETSRKGAVRVNPNQKLKIKQNCDRQQSASDQHKTKDNNNCQVKKEQNKVVCHKHKFEKTNNATVKPLPPLGVNLKTSIYDWDSPSSFTGTVKRRARRPHSVGATTHNVERSLEHINVQNNGVSENSTLLVKAVTTEKSLTDAAARHFDSHINIYNNNAISASKVLLREDEKRLKRRTIHNEEQEAQKRKQHHQQGNNKSTIKPANNMPKSQRQGKEKSTKLRHSKSLAAADRNANNSTTTSSPTHTPSGDYTSEFDTLTASQHSHASAPGTLPTSSSTSAATHRLCNASFSQHANELHDETNAIRDANYMELSFYNGRYTGAGDSAQFTELFRDFPVSYESTAVITNAQFAKCGASAQNSPKLPPYREPAPPTPPPISQMPTRESRYHAMQTSSEGCGVSVSAPVTPSRGKVVLSKKERKELSKLNARLGVYDGSEHAGGSASAQSSPYKGRVSELKNCLARGLFASLSRGSQKSLTSSSAAQQDEVTSASNEISPPPPAPSDVSPPNSNASNNNDADYSDKLKNLPVRQRKTHVSHMDNYCLFDPVDFINEKQLRQRTQEQLSRMFEPTPAHGLRDPLFSSQQNLNFSEEESVPEVIYNEDLPEEEDSTLVVEVTYEQDCAAAAGALGANFDHHNYFVIDPDDFEQEPATDIGIPNQYTNEQIVHANLEALAVQTTCNADEPILRESASLEQLLEVLDTAPSMSNSQESKDTNTTASTTTTTSTALVESSTSTNSTSSSTSATSSQTTLQRTKKKLTFLNLSPFRTHSTKNSSNSSSSASAIEKRGGKRQAADKENDNKTQNSVASAAASALHNEQRAISELVSSEHMLHLQHMLLDGKEHLRARTVPIESNYVLFNPGPVPSRNVPYKIRKPRPLSSHSDADSGFLSPCSPDELSALKFNSAILVLQQCDSVQGYIEVSGSK